DGNRVDLSSSSAQMVIRQFAKAPTFSLHLSTTNNMIALESSSMATDNVPSGS
ncbi:unnamed protein product, partial [marine sediment metagenome]